MIYSGKGGLKYEVSQNPLAAGGEGEIFLVISQSDCVAKIYKHGKATIEKERKLIKMVSEPPDQSVLSQIAWPRDVLYSNNQFVGFTMPKMAVKEVLNVIYEYGNTAKYPDMPWESKIIIAENLCAVLHTMHKNDHVCGDLNPKNISIDPSTGLVVFLDTDSYHIKDGNIVYRCDVGIPEYLPVEIQNKMRGGNDLTTANLPTFSKETDNFALAIHIFQLLMNGVHPFACAILPSQSSVTAPQPSDNIIKGEFPFMQNIQGVKIPAFAPEINILSKEIQDLFKRAFIKGHKNPNERPRPEEWHQALRELRGKLKKCKLINHHQYYKGLSFCPWCDADSKYANVFQTQKSLMLTQTAIKAPTITNKPTIKVIGVFKRARWWSKISFNIKLVTTIIILGVIVLGFGVVNGWFNGKRNLSESIICDSIDYREPYDIKPESIVLSDDSQKDVIISDSIDYGNPYDIKPESSVLSSDSQKDVNIEIYELVIGNIIEFGKYKWRILDINDGKALIITEDLIGYRPYNNIAFTDRLDWFDITWEDCDIREYLNGDFFESSFNVDERNKIAITINVNKNNQEFGYPGGNETTDKIFLLSIDEVVKYFGDSGKLENSNARMYNWEINDRYNSNRAIKKTSEMPLVWWLRSPGGATNCAAHVCDEGRINLGGSNVDSHLGVRPALWLNLEPAVDISGNQE